VSVAVRASPAAPSLLDRAWFLILCAGGTVWTIDAFISISAMAPYAGKWMEGQYVLDSGARALQHVILFLLCAAAYALAWRMGWPGRPGARLLVVAAHLALAWIVLRLSMLGSVLAFSLLEHSPDQFIATLKDLRPTFPTHATLITALRNVLPSYVMGLFAVALVTEARRHHRDSLAAAEFARAYTRSQLNMLSAQLQPHFLFNALHAASELIEESPERAQAMIARLGDFLRHAIDSSHSPWVPLRTELAGLEGYLAVQAVRFQDSLQVSVHAEPATLDMPVPSLMLQPLVENAIEHGRDPGGVPCVVDLRAGLAGNRLVITVCNSRPTLASPLQPATFGAGLRNVSQRLEAAYGGDATLRIGPAESGTGTAAILTLPTGGSSRLDDAEATSR